MFQKSKYFFQKNEYFSLIFVFFVEFCKVEYTLNVTFNLLVKIGLLYGIFTLKTRA